MIIIMIIIMMIIVVIIKQTSIPERRPAGCLGSSRGTGGLSRGVRTGADRLISNQL